jgi:voltage-gated potassium channel
LEHGTNPQVKAFGDAMYLAFVTTSTLGNGNTHPITAEGQVLSGLMIFFGIGLVGFVSAQLTARLLQQDDPNAQIQRELSAVRMELRQLRGLLEPSIPEDTSLATEQD